MDFFCETSLNPPSQDEPQFWQSDWMVSLMIGQKISASETSIDYNYVDILFYPTTNNNRIIDPNMMTFFNLTTCEDFFLK